MNKTYDYVVKSKANNLVVTFDSNKDSYFLDDYIKGLKVKCSNDLYNHLNHLGCRNIEITKASDFQVKNHKTMKIKEGLYAVGFLIFVALCLLF